MGLNDDCYTNWYEWDKEAKKFSYQKTEDHIFAPYTDVWNKRIGDMTRDELIQVIAAGYHDREELAKALLGLISGESIATLDGSLVLSNGKAIVQRLKDEGKLDSGIQIESLDDSAGLAGE